MQTIKKYYHLLPFDINEYKLFLDDDDEYKNSVEWFGVSIQIKKKVTIDNNDEAIEFNSENIELLTQTLISLISHYNINKYILIHEYKDFRWIPKWCDDNLPLLRKFFSNERVSPSFKGALVLDKFELISLANDLVIYPYILSYKDIDIVHPQLPIIIKISDHLCIDVLSTKEEYIDEVKNIIDTANLNLVMYRK